jgi:hypothetical protein
MKSPKSLLTRWKTRRFISLYSFLTLKISIFMSGASLAMMSLPKLRKQTRGMAALRLFM